MQRDNNIYMRIVLSKKIVAFNFESIKMVGTDVTKWTIDGADLVL